MKLTYKSIAEFFSKHGSIRENTVNGKKYLFYSYRFKRNENLVERIQKCLGIGVISKPLADGSRYYRIMKKKDWNIFKLKIAPKMTKINKRNKKRIVYRELNEYDRIHADMRRNKPEPVDPSIINIDVDVFYAETGQPLEEGQKRIYEYPE